MDINKIQSVYGTNSVSKVKGVNKVGKTSHSIKPDQVNMSTSAVDFKTALSAIMKSDEVRSDMVDSVKEKMDNGTYDYDIDGLVDKILNKN